MKIEFGKRFWIVATGLIVAFSLVVIGKNLLHAVRIKRQIALLEREYSEYQTRIAQDSTLVEQLRYDDYLEEYARENYHMQRRDERVYIVK